MRNLALIWVLAACLLGCGGKTLPSDTDTTFTDKRDGKVYKKIKIGNQIWMAENLNYAAKKAYVMCYDNDSANCAKYGRLYMGWEVHNVCPVGWHLPTDEEWTTLMDYLGDDSMVGTKLKSSTGWNSKSGVPAGTDDYGFSALPGGKGDLSSYSESGRSFGGAGRRGLWWSATRYSSQSSYYGAWYREMAYDNEYVYRAQQGNWYFLSVRCVLDDEKERRK